MKFLKLVLILYVFLLALSTFFRFSNPAAPENPEKRYLNVSAVSGTNLTDSNVSIAFKDFPAQKETYGIPVILLHGSPGDSKAFDKLVPLLSEHRRIIVPDLPGFGDSTLNIPDYSFLAHASYLRQLMEELNVPKAHIVGFSMGSGVVLSLYEMAPERLESITLMSAIGVQEYELLGSYDLNHGIHGLQLGLVWMLQNLTPHFGNFDGTGMSYCRNFFDSDQRPLRSILTKIELPALIIHGTNDLLVPVEAASEHARIVPQSEFHEIDDDHFYTFMRPDKASPLLLDFFDRVEKGSAITRSNADSSRKSASQLPFSFESSEAKGGIAFVIFLLLAVSTFISEDLTCIAAGVLAGQGRISLSLAIFACITGIYVGDLLLFFAGRIFGRSALKVAPFKWFISENSVEKASVWFRKKGVWAIFMSRFIPGLRLPTYFVAGVARTNVWLFAVYFLLAVLVWTPLFVALSYKLGEEAIKNSLLTSWWQFALFIILLYVLIRLLIQCFTWRGRRLLLGKIGRWRFWEFWSMKLFYPPVIAYIIYLAIRHRGINTFTCANPSIFASGFVGESKDDIYRGLLRSDAAKPHFLHYIFLQKDSDNFTLAKQFIAENRIEFPVVLKPDVGERGLDVFIIKDLGELESRLETSACNTILQEFASGDEFGVFYYRYPNEPSGKIFAITEKQFPYVVGDGISTLETLILKDKRAICLAEKYFERNEVKLDSVIAAGEKYQLVDIGTHSRGAIFLDGSAIHTTELEQKIDEICKGYEGFYFGRFDIRTPSVEDFKLGENFKIVELNGVTSEATNIYDRKNSLFSAYKTLFEQWRIAFEIGSQNRANGVSPTKIRELLRLLLKKE